MGVANSEQIVSSMDALAYGRLKILPPTIQCPLAARNRTSEGNVRFRGLPCPGDDGLPAVSRFKFVTEIFFIMQRALHVGLLPAVQAYSSMVSDLAGEVQSDNPDEKIQVLFSVSIGRRRRRSGFRGCHADIPGRVICV